MLVAPLIGLSRHRIGVDGKGVTTLVAFHGCPLSCAYCLNRQCLRPDGMWREVTTQELLEEVAIDNLYFQATGGGICFGGGEPCLRSAFIAEFAEKMPPQWTLTLETSLHVNRQHVERLLPLVGQWIVDIKDMNPTIYERYTGQSGQQAYDNLQWLLQQDGMKERVMVRLPLIPEYNNEEDIARSKATLEEMGASLFDEFQYIIKQKKVDADRLSDG